jgi:hypothetical protein
MLHRFSFLFMLLILPGCSKPIPALQNFDNEKWKTDKNGCAGERQTLQPSLAAQRDKLLGLEELQLIEYLGRPDQNELSKRNQKFYFYFIDPSPVCGDKIDSTAKKLTIRFNAVGLSKEVLIE